MKSRNKMVEHKDGVKNNSHLSHLKT